MTYKEILLDLGVLLRGSFSHEMIEEGDCLENLHIEVGSTIEESLQSSERDFVGRPTENLNVRSAQDEDDLAPLTQNKIIFIRKEDSDFGKSYLQRESH